MSTYTATFTDCWRCVRPGEDFLTRFHRLTRPRLSIITYLPANSSRCLPKNLWFSWHEFISIALFFTLQVDIKSGGFYQHFHASHFDTEGNVLIGNFSLGLKFLCLLFALETVMSHWALVKQVLHEQVQGQSNESRLVVLRYGDLADFRLASKHENPEPSAKSVSYWSRVAGGGDSFDVMVP